MRLRWKIGSHDPRLERLGYRQDSKPPTRIAVSPLKATSEERFDESATLFVFFVETLL
jgi:hypothetical protein